MHAMARSSSRFVVYLVFSYVSVLCAALYWSTMGS